LEGDFEVSDPKEVTERDRRKGGKRKGHRKKGGEGVEESIAAVRDIIFLREHFNRIRQGMKKPEGPNPKDRSAVRPNPILNDGGLLTLKPRMEGREIDHGKKHDTC